MNYKASRNIGQENLLVTLYCTAPIGLSGLINIPLVPEARQTDRDDVLLEDHVVLQPHKGDVVPKGQGTGQNKSKYSSCKGQGLGQYKGQV